MLNLLIVAVAILVGILIVSSLSYTTKRTIVEELFENPEAQEAPAVALSPTLHNLLGTPAPAPAPAPPVLQTTNADNTNHKKPVNVDALAHAVDGACADSKKPSPPPKPLPPVPPTPSCPSCPVCPDMSQYIRMDEIPCWNCTLP